MSRDRDVSVYKLAYMDHVICLLTFVRTSEHLVFNTFTNTASLNKFNPLVKNYRTLLKRNSLWVCHFMRLCEK